MVTFEVDLNAPKDNSDDNERFDGALLNYVDLSLDKDKDYKSFSLFDYNQLNY